MITPGLVSVTFRQLSPLEIVNLVAQAELKAIEWGGDVHVPHGQVETATDVAKITADAGLDVAAYGSYYRVSHDDTGPFETVLETAVALAAPTIRVWAGRQGTNDVDDAYFDSVVADSRRIADLAAAEGIGIVYEFHANTLTDTNEAARKLLETVAHPNIQSLWQPPRFSQVAYNLVGIQAMAPWLTNVHVFNWHRTSGERLALAAGAEDWAQYLAAIHSNGLSRYALIEFVRGDEPEQFLQDALVLRSWLENEELQR